MKEIITLTLLALIAGCLLASLHIVTQDRIDQNQRNAEAEVLAGLVDTSVPELLREQGIELVNIETKGYGGKMKIVVAFRKEEILGVRVLSHGETPGFSNVLKPTEWINQFAERPVEHIDAVSGATITTTAVRRAVQDVIRNRKKN